MNMYYYDAAYASCVMTCATLYALSYRRPPPPPKSSIRASADSLISSRFLSTITASVSLFALAPAIGIIALVASSRNSPHPNSPSSNLFCPQPTNVNPIFLTFNKMTVAVLLCTFCGSLLRYTAMVQLGQSFTWELARPAGAFKQDGLYRYMQHPSYTGAFIANLAFLPFFWRLNGPLGCWIPASWTAHSQWANRLHYIVVVFVMLWTLWKRIPEEEAMMKREFGKQWVEYHRHTKRFVAGLF